MAGAVRGSGGKSLASEYERHRRAVIGMLAKRFPRLADDEKLALYHDAWARVLTKRERGEEIESLRAYLIATSAAEALHSLSRGKPPAPVGPDDPLLTTLPDEGIPIEEEVIRRDQVRIARDLIDSLDRRQREVMKLRWDLQLSGREVRAALGLSQRQYQRLVEQSAVAIADRVKELKDGTWSRRQKSLLAACLVQVENGPERRVGIASDRRRKEAQRLLESDPHVAALYAEVRTALRGAAAFLPLPVIVGSADASAATRLTDLVAEVRNHVAGAVETGKQQATSLYLRVGDPSMFSTARPGTIVAVAALAVGGGTVAAHEVVSERSSETVASAQELRGGTEPTEPALSPTRRRQEADKRKNAQQRRPAAPLSAGGTTQSSTTATAPISSPPPAASQPAPPPASDPPPAPSSGKEFSFED